MSSEMFGKRYKEKVPDIIEFRAITFDEFIEYGITAGANVVDGMPWSFHYLGHRVTHESDSFYSVDLTSGISLSFERGQILMSVCEEEMFVCAADMFDDKYEIIE